MFKKQIEPSLLAFKPDNISHQLTHLQNLNIKIIHYDVMNMDYVNNTSFGTEWIKIILQHNFLVNVHIMALDPFLWIEEFKHHKIHSLTFHYEPLFDTDTIRYLTLIKNYQINAGIAIKPYSLPITYQHLLKYCDVITIMSVEPGKGGQAFIKNTLLNLIFVFNYRQKHQLNYIIQIDGGINIETVDEVLAYADNFIMGSGFVNQSLAIQQQLIKKIEEQNDRNK